jgi:hypothetical protein
MDIWELWLTSAEPLASRHPNCGPALNLSHALMVKSSASDPEIPSGESLDSPGGPSSSRSRATPEFRFWRFENKPKSADLWEAA